MRKTIKDGNSFWEAEGDSAETIRAYMWHMQKMAARFPGNKPGKYKFGELLEYVVERKKRDGVTRPASWRSTPRARSFYLRSALANLRQSDCRFRTPKSKRSAR